jgi:drug/metabolite transporter (DMT)-like permease
MTPTLFAGLALALLSSLALNGGFLVQHRGSRAAPAVSVRRPLRTLRGLLASPVWLAGTAVGLAGWGLYITALSQAPLSLVQAFSAGGLALVVPLAARLTGARLARADRRAIVLMGCALAALGVGSASSGIRVPDAVAMTVYLAIAVAVAAALAAAPARRRRAHALGLAAGVLYGAADAATKAATGAAHAGLLAGLLSPWTAVVVGGSIAAFFCFQRGLQIGPALPVIALMTAATNVVAIGGGVTVFAESLGTTAAFSVLHAGALVAVAVCAWWLAPAQARLADTPEARTEDGPPDWPGTGGPGPGRGRPLRALTGDRAVLCDRLPPEPHRAGVQERTQSHDSATDTTSRNTSCLTSRGTTH